MNKNIVDEIVKQITSVQPMDKAAEAFTKLYNDLKENGGHISIVSNKDENGKT